MPTRRDEKLDEISKGFYELKGMVSHFWEHWKVQDARAKDRTNDLHDKFETIRSEVQSVKNSLSANTVMTANVQQDIAEMKNEMANHETTLDDYKVSKPTAVEAIKDLKVTLMAVQQTVRRFEDTEKRALGWFDFIYRIGWIGWTIVCGIGAGAIMLGFYYLQRFV